MRGSGKIDTPVQEGTYEIQHALSGLYLDSINGNVYNGMYDDVLILNDKPSRFGKARSYYITITTIPSSNQVTLPSGNSPSWAKDIPSSKYRADFTAL